MDDAFDVGAEDVNFEEDAIEITCQPNDLRGVREGLEAKGYTLASAEVAQIPSTTTTITDPELVIKMNKLLDALEENDDVQNVFHNWDMPEEPDEE